MRLRPSSSMRCINNGGPALKLAAADGASRLAPAEEEAARLQHVVSVAPWVGQDGGGGAGGCPHRRSSVPPGAAVRR